MLLFPIIRAGVQTLIIVCHQAITISMQVYTKRAPGFKLRVVTVFSCYREVVFGCFFAVVRQEILVNLFRVGQIKLLPLAAKNTGDDVMLSEQLAAHPPTTTPFHGRRNRTFGDGVRSNRPFVGFFGGRANRKHAHLFGREIMLVRCKYRLLKCKHAQHLLAIRIGMPFPGFGVLRKRDDLNLIFTILEI